MKDKHLLLVYYHPVIFDLAETFKRIFETVTIAVNPSLKDNYGDISNVMAKVKANPYLEGVKCVPSTVALLSLNQYDLIGCDGVFDGDKLFMDLAKDRGIPYFCINGYPHQLDEPSENIMAFSWHIPQIQYKQAYPHEGYVKERDWKNIAEKGRSDGKNILVYYPEMNEAKRFAKANERDPIELPYLLSLIHRYEECNKWCHDAFKQMQCRVENHSELSQMEAFDKILNSDGLLHLKHADCPGISVLEALILGRPVFTMESFVRASFNQEVLIDGFNAVVAPSIEELKKRILEDGSMDSYPTLPAKGAVDYIWSLTDYWRQLPKLLNFFERCMS